MDFEAEEVKTAIPSRSTYMPSDKQKSYKAGDTLRFHIPASVNAFLDPRMTTLNFKVKLSDTTNIPLLRFSNKCGLHSLIDNIRVYDANSNLQLETIQNYGEIAQKLHLYSENRSIRNKRALIEGLEYTSRDFDSELYEMHLQETLTKVNCLMFHIAMIIQMVQLLLLIKSQHKQQPNLIQLKYLSICILVF